MTNGRVHSLDAARALLLVFGIPYHVATKSMFDLPVPNAEIRESVFIGVAMSVNHSFRMFAFFVLSGFFSALIIHKRGRAAWAKDRLWRLGVPLIASLLTIGVAQFFIHRDILGLAAEGMGPLPVTVDHMWFLMVLLMFVGTLYLIPIEGLAQRPSLAKAVQLRGWQGFALVSVLAFWGIARAVFDRVVGEVPGIGILSSYIYFAPAFAIGTIVYSSGLSTSFFKGARPWQFFAAVILSVVSVVLDTAVRPAFGITSPKSMPELLVSNALELPLALLISLCFFALLERLIKRESASIRFLVGGAMAIYLFHMIWTLLVVKILLYVSWPGELQWALGSLVVFGLSALSYLAIRQNAWLSAAFSGAPLPKGRMK